LDEALAELSDSDREVILLRFFEERDYATVGARFNLTDNTARMRVERALEKLRARLERRGVTSTSAALGVALANQAVMAAPVGLAATVTGAVIAGGGVMAVGASAGSTAAAAGFMSMTKLQLGISGALAMAGATGLVVQAGTNAQLRDEIATLRRQNSTMTTLEAENRQLARTIAEANDMRRDDAEFARLQEEAAGLKTKLQQIAKAEQERAAQAQSRAEVFSIAQLDRAPSPRFQARPQYPAEMRAAGTGGEVVVDFVVNAAGDVVNAIALRSTQREFEAAAVEAVSKWKFKAGQKGGHDVATHMQVPIVFAFNQSEPKRLPAKAGSESSGDFTVKLSTVQVPANGVAEQPAPGGK
jgi:TonB family protein